MWKDKSRWRNKWLDWQRKGFVREATGRECTSINEELARLIEEKYYMSGKSEIGGCFGKGNVGMTAVMEQGVASRFNFHHTGIHKSLVF